jgi:hypothetical protein
MRNSECPRADKFTLDNVKGLRVPLFEVKRITDHSHNISGAIFRELVYWMTRCFAGPLFRFEQGFDLNTGPDHYTTLLPFRYVIGIVQSLYKQVISVF